MNTYQRGLTGAIPAWIAATLVFYWAGQFNYNTAVFSILGGDDLVMIFGLALLSRHKPQKLRLRPSVIYFSIPVFVASFLLFAYTFLTIGESFAFNVGLGLTIVGTGSVLFMFKRPAATRLEISTYGYSLKKMRLWGALIGLGFSIGIGFSGLTFLAISQPFLWGTIVVAAFTLGIVSTLGAWLEIRKGRPNFPKKDNAV